MTFTVERLRRLEKMWGKLFYQTMLAAGTMDAGETSLEITPERWGRIRAHFLAKPQDPAAKAAFEARIAAMGGCCGGS